MMVLIMENGHVHGMWFPGYTLSTSTLCHDCVVTTVVFINKASGPRTAVDFPVSHSQQRIAKISPGNSAPEFTFFIDMWYFLLCG